MGYQRPRTGENFENLGHFSKKELYRSGSGQKILDRLISLENWSIYSLNFRFFPFSSPNPYEFFYFLGSSPTFSLSLDPLLHQKYLDQFLNECGGIIAEHVAEHGVEAGPTGVEELGELARILELVQGQLAGFVRGR